MKQKWYQNYRLDKLKKHGWDYLRSLIDVSR